MPINRNTRSNGAPKRSASRLDRMPAITRTEPRRMAMLTESREAMNLREQKQILAIASLSSPQFAANPFLLIAAMCPIYGLRLTSLAWRYRWHQRRGYGNLP